MQGKADLVSECMRSFKSEQLDRTLLGGNSICRRKFDNKNLAYFDTLLEALVANMQICSLCCKWRISVFAKRGMYQ